MNLLVTNTTAIPRPNRHLNARCLRMGRLLVPYDEWMLHKPLTTKPTAPHSKPLTQPLQQYPPEPRIYHQIIRPFHAKDTGELLVYFSHIGPRVQCVPFLYTELWLLESHVNGIVELVEPYFQMNARLYLVKIRWFYIFHCMGATRGTGKCGKYIRHGLHHEFAVRCKRWFGNEFGERVKEKPGNWTPTTSRHGRGACYHTYILYSGVAHTLSHSHTCENNLHLTRVMVVLWISVIPPMQPMPIWIWFLK